MFKLGAAEQEGDSLTSDGEEIPFALIFLYFYVM